MPLTITKPEMTGGEGHFTSTFTSVINLQVHVHGVIHNGTHVVVCVIDSTASLSIWRTRDGANFVEA